MRFEYEPRLRAYMEKTGKKTIVVELVEVNTSDFDVTELSVHFVDARMRKLFLEKKGYRLMETELGEVLLPRFPLEMEETVSFGLKDFIVYKHITYEGIKV